MNLPYTVNAVANRTSGASYQRLLTGTVDVRILFGSLNGNYITATGNGVSWNDIATANSPTTAIGLTPRVLSADIVNG